VNYIKVFKNETKKYQFLIDKLDDIIWMLDLKLNTIYVSPSIEKKLGFTPDERMRQDPREQMTLDSYKRAIDRLKEEFKREQEKGVDPERIIKIEVEYYHKNGSTIWFENIVSGIRDENGTLIGIHGISRDITERKKAEQKFKESEEKLKFERDNLINILNSMEDGVYIVNQKYDIQYVNPALMKEFGSYKGVKCYTYFHDRQEICPWCKISEVALGNTVRWEWYSFKNQKTYDLIDTPIRDFYGTISKLEIFRDITEIKKNEQELTEAFSKADFYKDLLAHDIANVLNNINISMQLMEMWKDDPTKSDKKEEMMEIIKQQLERGESLILNVRKISKIEGEDQVATPVDVKITLEKAIEHIRSRFQEKEIDIKTELSQGIVNVEGGDLLIDAFENILLNGGIHNNSDKIQLWIKLSKVQEEGESFVKVEFKDNGIGIIEARKETIFNRDYKRDRSTGGMGIGLSLVKKIIDVYGGQVWIENRVEGDHSQGSNFIVMLKEV